MGDNLSHPQQRAIAALISSPTLREAAEVAGVNERTIHRYMQEPAFQAALRAAEGRAIDDAVRQLVGLATEAIGTLRALLADEEASAGVKLRAAQTILDRLTSLRDLRNLEERLTRLEKQLEQRQI